MAKTTNLGLEIATEDTVLFKDWRNVINGQGAGTEADPKSNTQIIDEFAGAIQGVSGSVTLTSGDWSGKVYSLMVESLGANDAIFFSPMTAADKTALENANCIVATNGTLVTFTATTAPTEDVELNYFIARGRA